MFYLQLLFKTKLKSTLAFNMFLTCVLLLAYQSMFVGVQNLEVCTYWSIPSLRKEIIFFLMMLVVASKQYRCPKPQILEMFIANQALSLIKILEIILLMMFVAISNQVGNSKSSIGAHYFEVGACSSNIFLSNKIEIISCSL